jgi:hypothetical protein
MNLEQKYGTIIFNKYLFLSVLIHFSILFAMAYSLSMSDAKRHNSSGLIEIGQFENNIKGSTDDNSSVIEKEKILKPENEIEPGKKSEQDELNENELHDNGSAYYGLSISDGDTSSLEQVYSESTLNVTVKYPSGWVFIDQNVKKKLDGVTFWLTDGIYNPPPYIHLEVKEKYLFDETRFKYSFEMDDNTAYYNDPEELEDQVSQIIYIRTDSDEDFTLKLIMNGRESFKRFQPVFFGMIKSFKFGKSFF